VVETRPSDPADYLQTKEDILYYLEAAMEGNDPKHIANALGDVARSQGMTEIARKAGVGRQRCTTRSPKTAIQRSKRSLRC
jgi:probable addiction module antidote protein